MTLGVRQSDATTAVAVGELAVNTRLRMDGRAFLAGLVPESVTLAFF